jgi:hypothetical protein
MFHMSVPIAILLFGSLVVVLGSLGLPQWAQAYMAEVFLIASQSNRAKRAAPSVSLLQACAKELLLAAQSQDLTEALRAAMAALLASNELEALDVLGMAVRTCSEQRRLDILIWDAPLLSRVYFDIAADASVTDGSAKRIGRYALFSTHRRQLILTRDQIETVTAQPHADHRRLFALMRGVTGSALPDAAALESWVDNLSELCLSRYNWLGDTQLIVRGFESSDEESDDLGTDDLGTEDPGR